MKILVVSFGPISEARSGYFNLVNESIKAMRKCYDVDSVEFVSSQGLSKAGGFNSKGRSFVEFNKGLIGKFWLYKLVKILLNALRMHTTVKKYDILIIETSVFFPYALVAKILHKKVIFAMHGLILEMAWNNKKRPVKYLEQLFQAYFLDKVSSYISDIILVPSNHDKEIAVKFLHVIEAKISLRPVVIAPPDLYRSGEFSKRAVKSKLGIPDGTFIGLIIGDYAAEQNRKALDFLFSTEHLFPENFILLVIGETYGRYSSTRKIKVMGYVESVGDYYEVANGLILPLSTGMGIKTKIIESMAYGLRVFTTSIGLFGIDLEECQGFHIYNLNEFWVEFKRDMAQRDYSKKCQCLMDLYSRKYSSLYLEKLLKEILSSINAR